jgi:hypothetical protein
MARIDREWVRARLVSSDQMTGRERGDVLEEVIAELISTIPGVDLVSRATKNAGQSREIDLAFRNRRISNGLEFFGPEILVECKNWDHPVGSQEVSWFATKLRRSGVDTGILIATNGITGNPAMPNSAFAELRDARSEGLIIVVVERNEFEAVESSDQLAHMLEQKRFAMKIYSRHLRASIPVDPPPGLGVTEVFTDNELREASTIVRRAPETVGDSQHLLVLGELLLGSNPASAGKALQDLGRYIQQECIQVDAVLTVGDLTFRGDRAELVRAWELVQDIAEKAGSRVVVSTLGNHDRYRGPTSPTDSSDILDLMPPFPISASSTASTEYIAAGFAVYDTPSLRIVSVDTSSNQDAAGPALRKATRSRLPPIVASAGQRPTNILVSHNRISDCVGGDDLSRVLQKAIHGPWIFVHGSNHLNAVEYSAGGGASAVEVSLSPVDSPFLGGNTPRASCILLKLPSARESVGLTIPGQFRAMDWHPIMGWRQLRFPSDGIGGFGFRGSLESLAGQIAKSVQAASSRQVDWRELLDADPRLAFVVPQDLRSIFDLLERVHGVTIRFADAWPILRGVESR